MKTIDELLYEGFADYHELSPYIRETINHGRNVFGFNEKTIILTDGSKWDYIPEDNIYELQQSNPLNSEGLRWVNSKVGYVDQDEEYY